VSFVFFITLFFLAAIAYTIYRKQQHASGSVYELRAARPRTLFGEVGASDQQEAAEESFAPQDDERASLLARAGRGDLTALMDARGTRDAALYGLLLDAFVKRAESSPEELRALSSFVVENQDLRGSVELSQAFSLLWEQAPDAASTASALHLAALSDDAEEFARVVERSVGLWREGRSAALGGEDLRALVESEYWVLDAEARASGAGFVLKQKLAAVRAELTTRQASST
jgi:hypothetical protein